MKKNFSSINELILLGNKSDLVILYNLDFEKSYIANRLNRNVLVIWRFFGNELYRYMNDQVEDDLSRRFNEGSLKGRLDRVWEYLAYLKTKYVSGVDFKEESDRAISRCDLFLCFSREEYSFLKRRFKNLPSLLRLPLRASSHELVPFREKTVKTGNEIILGNSRNRYNNHGGIIEILKRIPSEKVINYKFTLFFSYGLEGDYAARVRKEFRELSHVKIIEDFLSKEEFKKIYDDASALVINGYRQMALSNIYEALSRGVKVYLSQKNSDYHWFKNNGLHIFDIEDLLEDITMGTVFISKEEANHNISQLKKMYSDYTLLDFQNELLKFVESKKEYDYYMNKEIL